MATPVKRQFVSSNVEDNDEDGGNNDSEIVKLRALNQILIEFRQNAKNVVKVRYF